MEQVTIHEAYQRYQDIIQKRIERSVSSTTKVIFPNNINHHLTLFGGMAMAWMDEISFIAATRFCRKKLVTVSTERINFNQPIPSGTIVELTGRVSRVGRTSLTVDITVDVEQMHEDDRREVIVGHFNFVAVDEQGQSTPLFDEAFLAQS